VTDLDLDFFQALNFSRDPWANLEKMFVLGMTETFERQFMLNASDFYSFFLTSFHFNIEPPKKFAMQTETPYEAPSPPSKHMGKIAQHRYEHLLQQITPLATETFSDISRKTEQLFLDFLEAWAQYAANSPAEPPQILFSVLEALQKKESQWASTLTVARDLETIARAYKQCRQYTKAISYLEKALQIVVNIQGADHHSATAICSAIGENYYEQRDYNHAKEWFEKVLAAQKRQNDDDNTIAQTYTKLGRISAQLRDFTVAENWYEKSLDIHVSHDDKDAMAETYFDLGRIAQDRREFDWAEDWYHKSLDIALKIGNEHGVAIVYHRLGMIAEERRDFDTAESWYNKSLDISLKLGNEYTAATTCHQLGIIAQKRRDFDTAESLYNKSLDIKLKQGNEYGAAKTYHQLGITAQERRDFDTAESWYNKSLDIKLKQGDEYGAAQTYHQLGRVAEERLVFDIAEDYYKRALEVFIRLDDPHNAEIAKESLARLHNEKSGGNPL